MRNRIITAIIFVIVSKISFVWAVIEFILYLLKDKDFNWISVYLFVFSSILAIIFCFKAGIKEAKEANKHYKKVKNKYDLPNL